MVFFNLLNPFVMPKAFALVAMTACPVQSAPTVEVHFVTEKPYYSEAVNSAQLKKSMSKDKESTLNTDKRLIVFGVTTSVTTSDFKMGFDTLTDKFGNQCIYFGKAHFWITYKPAIFISSDILDMPCSLKTTRMHEKQHVEIDMRVMQEYLPEIQYDMLLYLQSMGYQGFGPYQKHEADQHRTRLIKELVAASKPMVEKLREVRRARQGVIDTEENYKREADKCPGDRKMIYDRFVKSE